MNFHDNDNDDDDNDDNADIDHMNKNDKERMKMVVNDNINNIDENDKNIKNNMVFYCFLPLSPEGSKISRFASLKDLVWKAILPISIF